MRCLHFVVLAAFSCGVFAEERFYTTVDAQGRVQVIKSEQPAVVLEQKPSSTAAKNVVPQVSTPVTKSDTATDDNKKSVPDTYQVGNETYIDSDVLEKKDFNLGDKKRFYYLPDGSLGSKVVETKAGIIAVPQKYAVSNKQMSFLASAYQQFSATELHDMYAIGQECFSKKYLKKNTKPFKASNNVWVRASLPQDKLEPDVLFDLSGLDSAIHSVRFVTFANTHKQPKFYLPVMVFLDGNGCLLSGAWQYWSQAHAATDKQYASVDGLITIPEHSAYMLSYRPVDTLKADIPSTREAGSFVVETN